MGKQETLESINRTGSDPAFLRAWPLIPGDHHTDPTIFTHCIKTVGSRHYVDGWSLTDAYGRRIRYADLPERIPAGILRGTVLQCGDRGGTEPGFAVLNLDNHADAIAKNDVAGTLVHLARRLIRGNTEHELGIMLRRPHVAVPFDHQSDALTPMEGVDDESLHLGYGLTQNLRCLARITPGVDGADVLLEGNGVIADWTGQGRAYHAIFEERPYQRRPQRTIILPDEIWNTHIQQFFNVLGKQDTGFLCLTLRQHGTDNHRFAQITRTGWPLADISAARIIESGHHVVKGE